MREPAGASGGSYMMNSAPGDSLALSFHGTQVNVIYVQGPSFGSFAIELDGVVVQEVNTNAPVYEFNDQFTLGGLSNGQHRLRIMPAQGVIAIDAFVVQGSVDTAPSTPTPTPTSTLMTTDTPTATSTVGATTTSIPLAPPITASMDTGAVDWHATSGWTLTSTDAYGSSGLSWQLVTGTTLESLRWNQTIDLSNLEATQSIQLSFVSRLHWVSGTAQVELSTDDGHQWLNVAKVAPGDGWNSQTVDLNAFAGKTIELQFVWEPDPAVSANRPQTLWGLDQVSLQIVASATPTATDAPPSATPTPTATGIPSPTDTPVNMPTTTETFTPNTTDTPTSIPTYPATASATPIPTYTGTSTPTPTDAPGASVTPG